MFQSAKRLRAEQLLERNEDVKRKLVDNECNIPPMFYSDLFVDEVSSSQCNVGTQKDLVSTEENIECSQAYFNDVDGMEVYDELEMGETYKSVIDIPLLSQSIYFLNKSHSKWVSVGLDVNLYFEPVIRIVGLKKQSMTMNIEEWKRFVTNKLKVMSYFNKDRKIYSVFKIGNMKISFDCFDGVNKILRMEKKGECLYISYEGLLELWNLKELINIRFENLKLIDYGKYYKNIIERLSLMEGDVKSNMENLIAGPLSESVCITKELIVYGLKKIIFDLQFYKATVGR